MPIDLQGLYETYFPLIREKCRRSLSDRGEAEDIAQETFIRLWQAKLDESDPRAVVGWIYRTSTRLTVDRFRSRKFREALHESATSSASSPRTGSDSESRQQLERLAQEIPHEELEIAVLNRFDKLSQPQIAQITQKSERTIRRLLQRLDQRLARYRTEALS